MLAYRLLKAQTPPEFQEVPDPRAGPGQVVVKVAGSGLCHTDFTVIGSEPSYWTDHAPPFTLGHEIAGWVEALGTGVTGFKKGDAVAVNPSWASCGRCHMCRSGEESHCLYQKGIRAPESASMGGTRRTSSSRTLAFWCRSATSTRHPGGAAHGRRHHDVLCDQAGDSRDLSG